MAAASVVSRLALVTGSTSGIGEGIAYRLAKCGHELVLTGFGEEDVIKRVRNECQSKGAPRVEYCSADLTQPTQIENMFRRVREMFGKGPEILVNNAGLQHVAPLEDFPVEKWDMLLAVNLTAAFHTTRLAVKAMKQEGWGRVINISSVHGLVASANKSAYCSSKFGLIGLTKVVALETAGTGVTCNAVCPGWVLTPLVDYQIQSIAESRQCSWEEAKDLLLEEKQPSKEFATPEEIGGMVAYLCSDDAAQVTGATLTMDGGWTTR